MVCMNSPYDFYLYVYPMEDPDSATYECFTTEEARDTRKAEVDKMVGYKWSEFHPAYDAPDVL